jgi:hypothetical protein
MMFIETQKRHINTFDLSEADDREEYDALLSDPLVTILEKKMIKKREEEWRGEGEGEVHEYFVVILEWESKHLPWGAAEEA